MSAIGVIFLGIILITATVIYLVFFGKSETVAQEYCTSDDQCPNSTICTKGTCASKPLCTSNDDCPNGSCIGGRCTNDTCQNNNQCQVGSVCQSGQCVVRTCTISTDCPNSSSCVNGFCQNTNCVSSAQCSSGYGCDGNICYELGLPCSSSITNDCFGGKLQCVGGICQGNTLSIACPSGWYSRQGFCFPQTSSTCPSGNIPVGGVCCPNSSPCGNICSSNGDCDNSCDYCLDGICRCKQAASIEYYPNYPFATCTENSSCNSGVCMNNYCVPISYKCNQNSQCTGFNANYCVLGQCQYGSNPEGSYCLAPKDVITCRSSGRGCVNAVCRAARGTLGEICLITNDCISGLTCSNTGVCSQQS